jgi:hypothetical protein
MFTNISESHFQVGDEVICKKSGMEGEVIKVDPEEKGKYYTVKREDGKKVKYAPNELKLDDESEGASKESESKFHKQLDTLVHKTFGKRPEEKGMSYKKKKKMKESFSNWREDLREIVDIPSSKSEKKKPVRKVDDKKNVNNEVKINPVMGEELEKIGGVLLEFVELDEADQISQLQTKRAGIDMKIAQARKKESQKQSQSQPQDNADNMMNSYEPEGELVDEKMNLKTADMGDVVKDFYKSDAPQFKGKSKKKRQQMAIAAKLTAERGGKKLGEESAVDLVTNMIRKQQGGTYSELKKKGKLSQPRTQRKPSSTKPTDMTKATDPRPGSRYRGD